MKKNLFATPLLLALALVLIAPPPAAFAADQEQELTRILNMSMADLTREARDVLDRKYPDENWDQYDFPQFVYTSDAVETGYKIAVKEPELLQNFKCYCFCDVMGHTDLRWCFLKEGERKNGYDDHAAGCNICYGQAMMALLWEEAGIPPEKMTQGFEKKFEKLIERFGHQ